jgi:hypothetical protein
MSAEATISTAPAAATIHPRWLRICHRESAQVDLDHH